MAISCFGFSQIIGSTESGNVAPKEAKAAELTTGSYDGNINLFTGTYSGSYPLGSVSTPQFSFDLNLNYGASFVTGDNPPVVKGIPYGEGWNVSIPTITVKNDIYHKSDFVTECGEQDTGPLSTSTYSFDHTSGVEEGEKEGDVYWFAPELNIPGVASGRAVFKYIRKGTNTAVFVLQGFEQYIELEYINGYWKAILPNGLIYYFNKVQANYRAATNHRVLNYQEISDVVTGSSSLSSNQAEAFLNVIMPKFEYTSWYCSQIKHLNFPTQSITFEYEQFGQFDYFKELHGYADFLDDTFAPHDGYTVNIGSQCNDMFIGSPQIYYAPIYSEILLKNIKSWGIDHGLIESLELDYSTEYNFGSNMLDFRDADVCRKDSLYSSKSVFSRDEGSDYTDWKRMVHPKSNRVYNTSINNLVWGVDLPWSENAPSKNDPYLISVDNLNYGVSSYFFERNQAAGTPLFDHGVLESPLIEFDGTNVVPGDRYEVKAKFHNTSGKIFFADINIVTGSSQMTPGSSNNINEDDYFISVKGPINDPSHSMTHDSQRGEEVFSTFGNTLKWPAISGLETSNTFTLNNYPIDDQNNGFQGMYIQIGGGNSDNIFSSEPNLLNNPDYVIPYSQLAGGLEIPEAYKTYYHYYFGTDSDGNHINGNQMSGDRLPHNFGIGLPWSQNLILLKDVMGLTLNSGITTNNYFDFWWNVNPDESTVNQDWESKPTLLNSETGIMGLELIRHSKNPYMLQSVKKYKRNGEVGGIAGDDINEGKVLVTALEMNYNRGNFNTRRNLDYDFDGNWVANLGDDAYKIEGLGYPLQEGMDIEDYYQQSTRFSQNIFTLTEIKNIPIEFDQNRTFSEAEMQNTQILNQQFEYELLETPLDNGSYDMLVLPDNYMALTKITNELGGIKEVEYYPLTSDITIDMVSKDDLSVSEKLLVYSILDLGPSNLSLNEIFDLIPEFIQFYNPSSENSTFLFEIAYEDIRKCGDASVTEGDFGKNRAITFSPLVYKVHTHGWDYDLENPDEPEQIGNEEILAKTYEYENRTIHFDMYDLDDTHFRGNEVISQQQGFEKVTVIEPDINGEEHKTIYHHIGRNSTADDIYNRLMFGKLEKVEKFSGTELIEKTVHEFDYTLAYENGFNRAKQTEWNDFEYADYIPSTLVSVYPDISNNEIEFDQTGNTGFSFFEYPIYLRHNPYGLGITHDPFRDNSYFIKTEKTTNTKYDNGIKLNPICGLPDLDPTYEDLANASGLQQEVNDFITLNEGQLTNELQTQKESSTTKQNLVDSSPLDDDVIAVLISEKPTYTCELFNDQEFISDPMFDLIWNSSNYSDTEIIEIANTLNVRSEDALLLVANDDTNFRSEEALISILSAPAYLSNAVLLALLNNSSISDNALSSLYLMQPHMPNSLIANIWNSLRSNEFKKDVLAYSTLNRSELLNTIEASSNRLSAAQSAELFESISKYPSEVYLNYYLNPLNCSDDQGLFDLLKISPNEFSESFKLAIDQNTILSDAQKAFISKYQDAEFAGSFVISSCACELNVSMSINEVTEYQYYEADYKGKIINDSYFALLDIDRDLMSRPEGFYLKYEPSWQLYSQKSYIEELPGAFSQQEYFYYYDLKNVIDRYKEEHYYADPRFSLDLDINDDLHWFFDGVPDEVYEPPYIDPIEKNRQFNMRSTAFQERTTSKNTFDQKPIAKSSYFEYVSSWNTLDDPEQIQSTDFHDYCYELPQANPNPDWCHEPQQIVIEDSDGDGETNDETTNTTFNTSYTENLNFIQDVVHGLIDFSENDTYSEPIPSGLKISSNSPVKDISFVKNKKPNGNYKNLVVSDIYESQRLLLKSIRVQIDTIEKGTNGLYTHFNPIMTIGISDSYSPTLVPTGTYESLTDSEGVTVWYQVYEEANNDVNWQIPYSSLKTFTVHKRDYFGEPSLIEDERGLLTQIIYGSGLSVIGFNPPDCSESDNQYCDCENYVTTDASDIGMPTEIRKGVYYNDISEEYEPRVDCLTSKFTYYPNSILESIEDPNGNIITQEHDHYGRMIKTYNQGDLLTEISYNQWEETNSNESFWDISFLNYVENKAYYNSNDALVSRSYVTPLGQTFASIAKIDFDDSYGNNLEFTSSNISLSDNWGRAYKSYKPRAYPLTSPSDFKPSFDDLTMPYTETSHEMNFRSRPISQSPFGETLNGHTTDFNYLWIDGEKLICELNLSLEEASEIMGEDPSDYWFYRTETSDPDNKLIFEYNNAGNQKVASRQIISDTEEAVTLFIYDSQGNVLKTINPIGQTSKYKYNLLGWLYEKETVDDGITRYMFDKSGNIVLQQDELGREGVNIETEFFGTQNVEYFRQFEYDDFNRITKQSIAAYHPDDTNIPIDGYYIKPASPLLYESTTEFIEYDAGSTEDYEYGVDHIFSNLSTLNWRSKLLSSRYEIPLDYVGDVLDPANESGDIQAFTFFNIEKEWAYGGNLESGVLTDNPHIYDNTGHTDISGITAGPSIYQGANNKGQISHGVTYRLPENVLDGPSIPIKIDLFSYDNKNRLQWEHQQLNYNGITSESPGNTLRIDYSSYDLQNNLLVQNLDFEGDNVLDFQYAFDYDGFGRLARIYGNFDNAQTAGNLLCELSYDNNTGLLASKKYFNNCDANVLNEEIYNEVYAYDLRDRMLSSSGELFDYEMAYDGNTVGHNSIGPNQHLNFNGNINGIKAHYKFDNTTETIDLFSGPTVYGYEYDQMNRLTQAYGLVWLDENDPFPIGPGNESYVYDKAGNLRSLKRNKYNSLGTGHTLGEFFNYQYNSVGNHLTSVINNGSGANRNYTLNALGQLTSDDFRYVEGINYRSTSLPQNIEKGIDDGSTEATDIAYFYDLKDQRIVKEHRHINDQGNDDENVNEILNTEVYWRDASGKELAITQIENSGGQNWTYYAFANERVAKIKPEADQQPKFDFSRMARQDQTDENESRNEIVRIINEAGANYPLDISLGVWNTGDTIAYISAYYLNNLENNSDFTLMSRLLIETEDQLVSMDRDGGGEPLAISIRDLILGGNGNGSAAMHNPTGAYSYMANTALAGATFYLNDHLGNSRVVFNKNHCDIPENPFEIESAMDYYPFGKTLREYHSNEIENYMTTQHERDGETGFDHRGARIYDSDVCKFLSLDPLASKYQHLSPFNYVANNPITFVDPNGKEIVAKDAKSKALVLSTMKYAFGENHGFSFKNDRLVHNGVTPSDIKEGQGVMFIYMKEAAESSYPIHFSADKNRIFYTDQPREGVFKTTSLEPQMGGGVQKSIPRRFNDVPIDPNYQKMENVYQSPASFVVISKNAYADGINLRVSKQVGGEDGKAPIRSELESELFPKEHVSLHEIAHAIVSMIMSDYGGNFNGVDFNLMSPQERSDWAIRYTNTLLKDKGANLENGSGQHNPEEGPKTMPRSLPALSN